MANDPSDDDTYWDVVVGSSSYATDGNQTLVMERKSAGVEEIKTGGAAMVWLKYVDEDGTQVIGGNYYKWADDESADDGATTVATFAALATAAVVALF